MHEASVSINSGGSSVSKADPLRSRLWSG
jgi:hypothetical protein